MENQRKNWRAENFLKKKIRKQGTFKRKNFAVEKFCKKILRQKKNQTWGAPPRLPRRRWARRPAPRYHAGGAPHTTSRPLVLKGSTAPELGCARSDPALRRDATRIRRSKIAHDASLLVTSLKPRVAGGWPFPSAAAPSCPVASGRRRIGIVWRPREERRKAG